MIAARDQAVRSQQLLDARLGGGARYQGHAHVLRRRLDAQCAQAVEIGIDGMTVGVRLCRVEMGKAFLPEAGAELRCHRPPRAQQAHQPGPARMHRQMHHEIVVAGTQRANQAPLGTGLALEALALPVAIDQVQLRKRGMPVQHRRRIGIHQRVDLAARGMVLECRNHRRGKQHVAVVAQLDHQRAAQTGGGEDGLGHPRILPDGQGSPLRQHMQFAFLLLDLIELFPETCRP
jgi:hypothetical protein